MEITNCATTKTFLKDILPPLTLNNPFKVFTGWKDDMNNAGYIPDKIPTTNGVRNKRSNTCHFIKIDTDNCCPEILLSHGSVKHTKTKAIMIEAHDTRTDSPRN